MAGANQYTGPKDPKERFLTHIVYEDDCWIWTGAKNEKGYGYFNMGNKKTMGSHRASYLLFNGEIPDGQLVCHECDNPACVNPKHLWLGSYQDNVDDMRAKGRENYLNGEDTPTAKLTEKQVEEIRSSSLPQVELCKLYNMSSGQISKIINRKQGGWA